MPDDPPAAAAVPRPALSERLRRVYPELTATERRAADFLAAAPAAILLHTGREISESAGISPASLSRLVRRLGYDSFAQARRAEQARRASGSPYELFDPGQPVAAGSLERAFGQERRLLEDTRALLNPQAIGEAVTVLAQARQVWFAGFRNNRFLADYARALFATIRPGTHPLTVPGQTLAESVSSVAPGDAVVAFGLRRRVAWFRPMLPMLQEAGAEVLLIADRGLRPPVAGARWTMTCAVETARPFDSYVGPMALTRLLALETLQRLGPDAGDRLGRIEGALARLRELE